VRNMFSLKNEVQNYDWGKIGSSSKVAELISNNDFKCDEHLPFAELWMGDYQLKSSALYLYIQRNKEKILGNSWKFDCLPFLFKILSVKKALSIQAHPDKILAEKLNREQPKIYRDSNHKPEIMIALSDFACLSGFRPLQEIRQFLKSVPELFNFLGKEASQNFLNLIESLPIIGELKSKEILKELFKTLMKNSKNTEQLKYYLNQLIQRISDSESSLDIVIKELNNDYPGDIGIFCIYFFNVLIFKPGEGIFISPNEPHAYLRGDCVECMARSDNVVRAGLTSKFIDIETLTSMLTYNFSPPQIICGKVVDSLECNNASILEFRPPVEEFYLIQSKIDVNGYVRHITNGPAILIVIEGNGIISHDTTNENIKKGSSFFFHPNITFHITNNGNSHMLIYQSIYQLPY